MYPEGIDPKRSHTPFFETSDTESVSLSRTLRPQTGLSSVYGLFKITTGVDRDYHTSDMRIYDKNDS